jgi:sugar transferase (PEP-CTERM/EpsH1 system associated)
MPAKMKILYVVPYVPSLIRVRPYNLIRFLGKRGNQVTVATLWSNAQEEQDLQALLPYCHDVQALPISRWRSYVNSATALPSRTPLQAVYSWSPAFAALLEQLTQIEKFDIIHVEHLRGAKYALHLRAKRPSIPIVWDSVDCISLLFRWATQRSRSLFSRLLTRLEVGRTERFEGQLIDRFDRVLVTSPIDKEALINLTPNTKRAENITVLTNGVDLDYFRPDPGQTRAPATVVVSGKMSYHANITMVLYLAREIMPHVWASRPDVRLQIVGKDPSPEIQALAKQEAIDITGSVPDLSTYLQRATMAVTPILYGVGIQNKVLEAMACATPVVSTPQAVSAINVQDGREVRVAQEPAAFARAILELLDNPEKRQQIGAAGREFVEKNHQWSGLAADIEKIYQEVCHARGIA